MKQRYRFEWLVLALVTLTAFGFYHESGAQDLSRLALTQSVYSDGALHIDRWGGGIDAAVYDGHEYSDKAPGMSFVALPAYAFLRVSGLLDERDEERGVWRNGLALLLVRVLTSGVAYVGLLFVLGRLAERLVPGTGAVTVVTVGLGTLLLPLAATIFGHVTAAALAFAAFAAVWQARRAPGRSDGLLALGGLCAGLAVLVEYQAAVIVLILLIYLAADSRRAALVYAAGGLPCALALGLYNAAAFGSPLHFSYSYVREPFSERQQRGVFGIGVPDLDGVVSVLFSSKGLLVQTPVLLAAAAGLVLLWRTGARAEALVCAAVSACFVWINAGYFEPIGGTSPGPRFFVPAIPFLAVGLPLAFRRWPIPTAVLAAVSVGWMLYRSPDWSHVEESEAGALQAVVQALLA